MPFESEFFDVIVAIDSFAYYGTDDLYLNYLTRFVKPGGLIGIAGAGLAQEIKDTIPAHLQSWWSSDLCCLHSAAWWRHHWARSGLIDVQQADTLADGWRFWLEWMRAIAPDNLVEIQALMADAGSHLGYVRATGRRTQVQPSEPIVSVPTQYAKQPLLRSR